MSLGGITLDDGNSETIDIICQNVSLSEKNSDGSTYNGSSTSDVIQLPVSVSISHDNPNYIQLNNVIKTINVNAVAYSGSTYYSTIEWSLSNVSSGTIYVIPNTNPVINNDCEIKSGVTLIIPFEDEKWDGRQDMDSNNYTDSATFADISVSAVNANRTNNITISSNKTLKVTGTLNIGAIIGNEYTASSGHIGVSGQTSGLYTQITLNSNAKITSTGIITALGYIKESSINNGSSVTATSGTISMPFVISDYREGTSTAGAFAGSMSLLNVASADGNIAPFNRYSMPNIQPLLNLYSSATLVGIADLYTGPLSVSFIDISAQHNKTNINIIGTSNSVINVASGAKTVIKYTPHTIDLTNHEFDTISLKIYGGASTGTMSLSVTVGLTVTIDTRNVYFPVPWNYSIGLYNGTYNFNNKFKFLTGSSLFVNTDATVNINSDVIFYSEFNDTCAIGRTYPRGKSKAIMTVAGTANINGAFGGQVNPSGSDATLNISSSANLTLTSKEGYGTRDGINLVFHETNSITETAQGYVYGQGEELQNLQTITYYSYNNKWIAGSTQYNIAYQYVLPDGYSTATITNTNPTSYKLTDSINLINATTNVEELSFVGWYLEAECVNKIEVFNGNYYMNNVTLYGKFVSLPTYTVTYKYITGSGLIDESNTSSYSTYSEKVVQNTQGTIINLPAEKEGYTFSHWEYNGTKYYPSDKLTVTGDITLIAKYTIKQYTISVSGSPGVDVTYSVTFNGTTTEYDSLNGVKINYYSTIKVTLGTYRLTSSKKKTTCTISYNGISKSKTSEYYFGGSTVTNETENITTDVTITFST